MALGTEFPGDVHFPDINPEIRDPELQVTGAIHSISADGDERPKYVSCMQPGANMLCCLCKVHRKDAGLHSP